MGAPVRECFETNMHTPTHKHTNTQRLKRISESIGTEDDCFFSLNDVCVCACVCLCVCSGTFDVNSEGREMMTTTCAPHDSAYQIMLMFTLKMQPFINTHTHAYTHTSKRRNNGGTIVANGYLSEAS